MEKIKQATVVDTIIAVYLWQLQSSFVVSSNKHWCLLAMIVCYQNYVINLLAAHMLQSSITWDLMALILDCPLNVHKLSAPNATRTLSASDPISAESIETLTNEIEPVTASIQEY